MQRFVRVVSKDLFILVRKIINCDIRNIFICWYGLMHSYCFEGRNGRTLVICTKLNGSYREICLPREVINIYPKHCEWVEKCICEHRVCFLVQESQINAGCAVVKVSDKYHFLIKLCFLYVLPWYRSNGYGKKLVDAVENYAFVNSLSGVYMTVNPKVNSMQKFISRCGYAKCGETDDGDYVFKRIFSS